MPPAPFAGGTAAVRTQLDQVYAAEAAFQKLPENRRGRLDPGKVRELAARKQRLLGQHAVLSTALDGHARLSRTEETLAATQRQLDTVDTALRAQTAMPQGDLASQLAGQREVLERETESLRQEQARWKRSLDAAAAAPLPGEEDAKGTARLVDDLMAVTREPEPDRPKPDRPKRDRSRDSRPAQAPPAQDTSPQRTRGDGTVGAPPRPGVLPAAPDRGKRPGTVAPPVPNPAPAAPARPKLPDLPKLPVNPKPPDPTTLPAQPKPDKPRPKPDKPKPPDKSKPDKHKPDKSKPDKPKPEKPKPEKPKPDKSKPDKPKPDKPDCGLLKPKPATKSQLRTCKPKPECRVVRATNDKKRHHDSCSPRKPQPPDKKGDTCGHGKHGTQAASLTLKHDDNCDKDRKPRPRPVAVPRN